MSCPKRQKVETELNHVFSHETSTMTRVTAGDGNTTTTTTQSKPATTADRGRVSSTDGHHESDGPETEAAEAVPSDESFHFSNSTSLEDLRKKMMEFIKERNWDQFHSPRNVLLALVGEVGELSEIFQWKGEVSEGLPELSEAERKHVGEELSDVLLYLIDLSQRCQVDLTKAVLDKMESNAKKYPIDKAYGKSNKYTDYDQE